MLANNSKNISSVNDHAQIMLVNLPDNAKKVFTYLKEHKVGGKQFIVGGTVIDLITEQHGSNIQKQAERNKNNDLDLVGIDVDEAALIKAGFKKSENKINHGTLYTYRSDDYKIDLTVYDNQVGDWLTVSTNDRDFTACSVLVDEDGIVYDPTSVGVKHILERQLSTIGDPLVCVLENPVRLLRAIKYMVKEFTPDKDLNEILYGWRANQKINNVAHLRAAVRSHLNSLKIIEEDKLKVNNNANLNLTKYYKYIECLADTGLLSKLFDIAPTQDIRWNACQLESALLYDTQNPLSPLNKKMQKKQSNIHKEVKQYSLFPTHIAVNENVQDTPYKSENLKKGELDPVYETNMETSSKQNSVQGTQEIHKEEKLTIEQVDNNNDNLNRNDKPIIFKKTPIDKDKRREEKKLRLAKLKEEKQRQKLEFESKKLEEEKVCLESQTEAKVAELEHENKKEFKEHRINTNIDNDGQTILDIISQDTPNEIIKNAGNPQHFFENSEQYEQVTEQENLEISGTEKRNAEQDSENSEPKEHVAEQIEEKQTKKKKKKKSKTKLKGEPKEGNLSSEIPEIPSSVTIDISMPPTTDNYKKILLQVVPVEGNYSHMIVCGILNGSSLKNYNTIENMMESLASIYHNLPSDIAELKTKMQTAGFIGCWNKMDEIANIFKNNNTGFGGTIYPLENNKYSVGIFLTKHVNEFLKYILNNEVLAFHEATFKLHDFDIEKNAKFFNNIYSACAIKPLNAPFVPQLTYTASESKVAKCLKQFIKLNYIKIMVKDKCKDKFYKLDYNDRDKLFIKFCENELKQDINSDLKNQNNNNSINDTISADNKSKKNIRSVTQSSMFQSQPSNKRPDSQSVIKKRTSHTPSNSN